MGLLKYHVHKISFEMVLLKRVVRNNRQSPQLRSVLTHRLLGKLNYSLNISVDKKIENNVIEDK